MKKSIFRVAALLMAGSLLALSCNKTDDPGNKPGGDDNTNTEQPGGDDGVKPMEINLDGSFADWDAITEDVADKNEYVDMKKGGSDDPIQVFKIANDADFVYFYIEYLADHLPQNDAYGTWGNSYDEDAFDAELGPDDQPFREVMHLFIDPDANESTGFYTFADEDGEDPAIPGLGCEMCAQFFMFFKPSTGLASVAWEQTIVGPTKTGKVGDDDQVDGNYTGDYNYNGTSARSGRIPATRPPSRSGAGRTRTSPARATTTAPTRKTGSPASCRATSPRWNSPWIRPKSST